MPFIRQEDIVNNQFPVSLIESYKINPGNELEGNTVANSYALGFGLNNTSPLQIKESANGSNINWADEQDISFYNQTYDEFTPTFIVFGGAGNAKFKASPNIVPINNGDLVGIHGDLSPGVWTSLGAASAMNTNRSAHSAVGNFNSAIVAGGYDSASARTNTAELFNGVTFSTTGNVDITKSEGFGIGSFFSMLYGAGNTGALTLTTKTSFYNGSNWTADTNVPTALNGMVAFGSYHAALCAGGNDVGGILNPGIREFNGTSFSQLAVSSLPVTGSYCSGAGTYNNGVIAGGEKPGPIYISTSQIFNGLTFIFATPMNTGTTKGAMSGLGTAAVYCGGYDGALKDRTETFNGHMWVNAPQLNINRSFHSATGSIINTTVQGNSNVLAANQSELFNQSTYRKVFPEDINSAANLGVAYNKDTPAAGKINVKLSGIVHNLPAGTANDYIVLRQNALDLSWKYQDSTNKPSSEDYLIGKINAINTKMHVFSHFDRVYNIIKRWG